LEQTKRGFEVKRFFLIFLSLLLLTAVSVSAQKKTEVLLKFSRQEGLMRIVFEAEEPFISKAKVTASASGIKIEFPEPFSIAPQKNLPFDLETSEKSLAVTPGEKGEIKFFRLSSPARLVFDIRKKELQSEVKEPVILQKVFVIDAGHGGYDFGITYGNSNEKDVCLDLAKSLGSVLSKRGKRVFLTRRADQYLGIADRISLVNQRNPDIFISLHFSVTKNFAIYNPKFEEQGADEVVDIYSLSSRQKKFVGKSKALADAIEKAIKDEFKIDVLRQEMPVPVLNSVGAPAVLIESPSPRFVVYDQQMKTRLVKAIINGVAAYGQ
jgi:N-acetylmuramoyl-L-alanine amidase